MTFYTTQYNGTCDFNNELTQVPTHFTFGKCMNDSDPTRDFSFIIQCQGGFVLWYSMYRDNNCATTPFRRPTYINGQCLGGNKFTPIGTSVTWMGVCDFERKYHHHLRVNKELCRVYVYFMFLSPWKPKHESKHKSNY